MKNKYILFGLLSLATLPILVYSGSSDNKEDDVLSLYTGVDIDMECLDLNNLNALPRAGIELTHKNASINLDLAYNNWDNRAACFVGMKMYHSLYNDKVFGGISLTPSLSWDNNLIQKTIAIVGGYRCTYSNNMYLSPYIGLKRNLNWRDDYVAPCLGLNVGYQITKHSFHSKLIHLPDRLK